MDKYLRQYAERGTTEAENIPITQPWQQVVVVPVCNESTEILRPFPPCSGRVLMILVVNESGAAPRHVSIANQEFAAKLQARFSKHWQSIAAGGLTLYHDPTSSRDILLVDRFNDGRRFPPKGGVGHARKTGADLAAFLVHRKRVHSPWIHCTDADVRLPHRYFTCSTALSDTTSRSTAALVYPYRHSLAADKTGGETPNTHRHKIMQITRLYEYSLRYYVAGLSFARSPYAFHTIGSTTAVNAVHYARVRGFPRREAGEDFYLLNKLAKVGSILQLRADKDCEPIEIAARLSDRVPFGTGAAVGRIMELEDPAREFLLYHPSVFSLLRNWLASFPTFWQKRSSDIGAIVSRGPVESQPGSFSIHSPVDLQVLIGGLEECGADTALQHAFKQSSNAIQFNRQMHTWFDAFRTLKFIHHLRDHHLPSVSFKALLTEPGIDYLLKRESTLPCLHRTLFKDWLEPEIFT